MKRLGGVLLGALVACGAACGGTDDTAVTGDDALVDAPVRDWVKQPAILDIHEADEVWAISDIHGAYVETGRLLEANGLATNVSSDPAKAGEVKWAGGDSYLVVVGDIIDKGEQSLATIDFLRALQASSNGHVIVTMGNHEAEFLADPSDAKFDGTTDDGHGIVVELDQERLDPKAMARGTDRAGRGKWLIGLPFAVKIKKWFFAHGGNTNGDSLSDLSARLMRGIEKRGFAHDDIIGNDSILEGQEWYGGGRAKKNADALDVNYIAFGHDPGAFDSRGKIEVGGNGVAVKLDINMGLPHVSGADVPGKLLHVFTKGRDRAEVVGFERAESLF